MFSKYTFVSTEKLELTNIELSKYVAHKMTLETEKEQLAWLNW